MKKCPNCGTLNNNDAKFCVNCGNDLSKVSSQQQKQSKSEATQPRTAPSREQFNNERTHDNINKQPNQPNYGKDVHNLLSDIKNSLGSSNGKRPWFRSLDGALAAVVILLIIIVVELGIAIANLSDIDNTVGASHNQDDDDESYVIQHHQHKMPKLYINHHEAHV